jgi:hypothetical protein
VFTVGREIFLDDGGGRCAESLHRFTDECQAAIPVENDDIQAAVSDGVALAELGTPASNLAKLCSGESVV